MPPDLQRTIGWYTIVSMMVATPGIDGGQAYPERTG